jgi:thymidylate synthase
MTDFITIRTDSEEAKVLRRYSLEKAHEEYKYLHLLERIMNEGVVKGDRTGTGTKSLFGTQLSFDVSNSFPILTSKKVYWKGVVEELLWFIRGETDSKKLEAKGVKIWTGNTSREFLDKKGLNYPEGYIGPGYGYQWRYWGKSYDSWTQNFKDNQLEGSHSSCSSGGVDQLANVINTLKKNPNDRRMIVSAWNVAEIDNMALPPCHLLFQFDVSDGKLNLAWYQRSNDFFLGSPFNISSYALLLCLVAKIVNLPPGRITYFAADTHLYLNHLEQAREQASRVPFPFPKLNIRKDIKSLGDIESLEFTDIVLEGYQSHAAIKAEMAV